MGERGGREAERGGERAERDPAKLRMPRPQLAERGGEPEEPRGFGAGERNEREAPASEEGARGGRHRGGVARDDVRGTDREHEAQQVVGPRARRRSADAAEGADLPGVEGDVAEGAADTRQHEEPRVTAGRKVFDHGMGAGYG